VLTKNVPSTGSGVMEKCSMSARTVASTHRHRTRTR
jgi:hypothetical protein